jgi:hypothetical protein
MIVRFFSEMVTEKLEIYRLVKNANNPGHWAVNS